MQTIHITANSRLSASIKQQAIVKAQQAVIQTPLVMTLPQWWQQWQSQAMLTGCLDVNSLPDKVLSAFEAQWLFEQCLEKLLEKRKQQNASEVDSLSENSTNNPTNNSNVNSKQNSEQAPLLLNMHATAKQLYQAWLLLAQWVPNWQKNEHMQSEYVSAETALLIEVIEDYLAHLQAKNWQDEALFSHTLLQALKNSPSKLLAKQFKLHGFDDLTPNIKAWQAIVESLGCQVEIDDSNTQSAPFVLQHNGLKNYAAEDIYDEVAQATQWALHTLNNLAKTKPLADIQIALVAPDVGEYKNLLSQNLDEQLFLQGYSALSSQKTNASNKLYNLSLGEPLLNVPLIENAWQLLNLFLQPKKTISYNSWSQWLTSAYTSGSLNARHHADAKFRRLQWSTLKWGNLLQTEEAKNLPKTLHENMQKWHAQFEPQSHYVVSLNTFIESLWQALNLIGWPGSRTLSSTEFQQKTALENAITAFSGLTDLSGKQNYQAWLRLLKRFLTEQIHQPKSVGVQPIQVMGMLEAGGQNFDGLWILGLTNDAWPRMPSPNPFIPMPVQRTFELPRSDANRELKYAQQLSQRLVESANNIVWSYPKQSEEASLLPTSVFPTAKPENSETVSAFEPFDYQTVAQWVFNQTNLATETDNQNLEWHIDNQGLALKDGEKAPGGTGILQAQSQCPLMAYVDYRLGAKYGFEQVEESLQNSNQGTLIHLVLEYFWQEVLAQPTLLAMSQEQRLESLTNHIDKAFTEAQAGLSEGIEKVEKARILELCLEWLKLEEKRTSFKVLETEQEHYITLAGIEFKIKIDRIDQVDGKALILDYKSGRASINNILKTPIKAPQLAVYLNATQQEVAGIGYGLLHSDDGVKFSALVEDDTVIDNARSLKVYAAMAKKEESEYHEVNWPDFLQSLKQEVLELAQQIKEGNASMRFESDADIQYAAGYLALRVPEVKQKMREDWLEKQALQVKKVKKALKDITPEMQGGQS